MPLLREPAALACFFLRAWPRHWVPRGALKVSSVESNVDKIRTAATTCWNNPHANWDPTNSPTQFELSSDALCKVCTRVLLESVPLPLHPDPFIPLAQLVDDEAMGSKRPD